MTIDPDSNKNSSPVAASGETAGAGEKSTPPESITRTVPLTEAQREIWYAAQMSETISCSFNVSIRTNLRGSLNVPRLWRSLCWLVERHEALRITFSSNGEVQHVHAVMPVQMPLVDLSALPPESRQLELHRHQTAAVDEPFDLVLGPVWRAQLIRLAPEEHILLLTVHHSVCDGSSLNLLLQELGGRYSAQATGEPAPTEDAPAFSDFVLEQETARQSPERKNTEAYWLELYSWPPSVLELPTDRPRSTKRAFNGASRTLMLNRELTQGLKRFSSLQHCSLVTTLLAGYHLLLHHLSGQSDIIVGLPMTCRSGESAERLVGHCVNFLPLRLNLEPHAAFTEHLGRVRGLLLQAHEHHNYTLASLLPKLKLPRGTGRMPLVPVMFNLDWMCSDAKFEGLETVIASNLPCYCRYDLSFSFAEFKDQMQLQCQYSEELFNADTIQRWLGDYELFLSAILMDSGLHLDELCRLAAKDKQPHPHRSVRFVPEMMEPLGVKTEPTQVWESSLDAEPLNAMEQALAHIWSQVIGLNEIGRNDDFFDLGGHSLLAAQVLTRITGIFHVELPLRAIFEASTIGTLAEVVAQAQREQPNRPVAISRGTREAKAEMLKERLEQLSEGELQELLRNPKLKNILQ
ncbi:MAG: non-ribosomal peptide synthetase [Pedosphaera sp.]|nr:non-ribosomal peptide synthetase [Pedosphaera sp.]